jgi:hypothetical protein
LRIIGGQHLARLGRGQRGDDASERVDLFVASLIDQALPFARRTAGAELQRVVDHQKIALVVEEPFVRGDLGVDANPEIHVRLNALGTRDRFRMSQSGSDQGHQHREDGQADAEERFHDCRAHLHSLSHRQSIVFKGVSIEWLRVMSRNLPSDASKILTAGRLWPT